MENQQERLLDLAWLAGILEADGTFQMNRANLRKKSALSKKQYWQIEPRILVVNTDVTMVSEIKRILRENNLAFYEIIREQTGIGHKLISQVSIVGLKRINRFIKCLLPYLKGAKKYLAQDILDFTNLRLERGKGSQYGEDEWNIWQRYESHKKQAKVGFLESSTTNTSESLIDKIESSL